MKMHFDLETSTRILSNISRNLRFFASLLVVFGILGVTNIASADLSASSWQLQAEGSSIRFQSIKNNDKIETSSFAAISGSLDTNGIGELKVLLDSVDTEVDLRNVRMRFLFFETFQYPEATVTLQLDPMILEVLPDVRRKTALVPYTLDLHGVKANLESELAFTLISDDLISVTTSSPIILSVNDFNLGGGLKKLMEAANVTILPSTNITLDLLFVRGKGETTDEVKTVQQVQVPASAALEEKGNFTIEACKGRFEILSRTDNIYFQLGSAVLDPKSRLILDSIVDIISRCPDMAIEVSGHTDSDGGAQLNQALSEKRAESVKNYFVSRSIDAGRITTVGYGAERPIVPNDSPENKRRNRRIEFSTP